jgi:hypothetical protein
MALARLPNVDVRSWRLEKSFQSFHTHPLEWKDFGEGKPVFPQDLVEELVIEHSI